MNAHDSEKVVGTLLHQGYSQVETPEAAHYIFYNTCSIRDKAEQKVFHRLDQFKRAGKGKVFGVLGCVAQQEGELGALLAAEAEVAEYRPSLRQR